MLWSVLVPVKRLELAKTRLTVPAEARAELALAMACDVVEAARGCASVTQVVVISDDPRARAALLDLGASLLQDEPDAGLNPALEHGFARLRASRPDCGVAVVSSDVPGATGPELDEVLAAAAKAERGYLSDRSGTGTTVLTARPEALLAPHYGPGSAAAHGRAGHRRLRVVAPGLSRDVDTLDDLAAVLAIVPAAAARTRTAVARLGLELTGHTGG